MSVSNVTGSPSLADLKDTTPVSRDNQVQVQQDRQVQAQQDRVDDLAARESEARRADDAHEARSESPRGNVVDTNA